MTEYAFPCIHEIDGNWQKEPSEEHRGMSLRDYFAAKAMQGFVGGDSWSAMCQKHRDDPKMVTAIIAKGSYELANAMLEARKK